MSFQFSIFFFLLSHFDYGFCISIGFLEFERIEESMVWCGNLETHKACTAFFFIDPVVPLLDVMGVLFSFS